MRGTVIGFYRAILASGLAVAAALSVSRAIAADIEAGLWEITTTVHGSGMDASPRLSSKCLTAEAVKDLATTFSPIANTINSICAPIERSFDGRKLTWHLVCKGQLDMELSGAFDFDSAHHYTGVVSTKASMAGQTMPSSQETLEGEWVSACPQ